MKKKHTSNFVMLYCKLLNDQSFKSLTSSAKVLYIYMRKQFNPVKYEDPLTFELSYKDMESIISSKTMSRAVKELINTEFIKKVHKGKIWGIKKEKTLYEFTGQFAYFYYKGRKIC